MTTKRTLCVAASCCLLFAGPATAKDWAPGIGVVTESGSLFTTEITPDDRDDYVFAGCPGMKLTVVVTMPSGSGLVPALTLFRPDGSTPLPSQGMLNLRGRRSSSVRFLLDATGTWKIRVAGEAGSSGPYSLKLTTGKPRLPPIDAAADANRQFRFTIPAQGGALIGYSLAPRGKPAPFRSFLDPRAHPVEGFPGGASVKSFVVPAGLPFGDYTLTFDAPWNMHSARVRRTLVLPKPTPKLPAQLSAIEPEFRSDGVRPTTGGPGGILLVKATGLVDPNAPQGKVGLSLGGVGPSVGTTPLSEVTLLADGVTVSGRLPIDLPRGRYDVIVTSTAGQPAFRALAFERLPAPVIQRIDPPAGPTAGGFEIVVSGRGFRGGQVEILFDGAVQDVGTVSVDDAAVRFMAPPHPAANVAIGVRDAGSGLGAQAPASAFVYAATPAIGRVTPPLVPTLSGETIHLEGVSFSATDRVFLGTTTPGVFEELTQSQTTYVDPEHHRFVAPLRPAGEYLVYVEDEFGRPNPRRLQTVTYFSFADATAAAGLGPPASDAWDATSSALADIDGDGDLDLVLSRRGGLAVARLPGTRVLRNDGHGAFSDATAAVMPPAGADDWRADRVVAADIDGDGFADLVLATNSVAVPPAGQSHTRILMNEARGGADSNERVLRDRTLDLMPALRTMRQMTGNSKQPVTYVSDDWRGLDLWVGDLDDSRAGPPEILLTHDETKNDIGAPYSYNGTPAVTGVYCGNYCPTTYGGYRYAYVFYWGGTRELTWDRTARGGLGRYRFEPSAFPRAWVSNKNLPATGLMGTFTEFTGRRLGVGDIDHDGTPDVAVLADHPLLVNSQWSSALQVALRRSDPVAGTLFTDITPKLSAFGYDLSGEALAVGATGFPDGNPFGTIAVTWSSLHPGRTLTLLQFDVRAGVTSVQDVTYAALPLPGALDAFQASAMRFVDADQDGDQDLVLVAPAAPGGTHGALRVLRNDEVGGQKGVLGRALDTVTASATTSTEHFEGDALAIGDVTGDGLLDYVVSRNFVTTTGPRTRVLATVK